MPKREKAASSAPAFSFSVKGKRIARGGTRRVHGRRPVAKEFLDAKAAEATRREAEARELDGSRRARGAASTSSPDRVANDAREREETLALAIRDALAAAEHGGRGGASDDEREDEGGGDGRSKRRRHENKGIGYIASKGRGRQGGAKENMLGTLDLADEETIRELLGHLPVGHINERAAIVKNLEKQHRRWFQLLRAGFNVLLYGFGSKKALMEDFEKRYFKDGGVIVVNGFFPALTPKQVVVAAAAALVPMSDRTNDKVNASTPAINDKTPTETLLAQIQSATRGSATSAPKRLYIVLHNIDGPQLRTSEAQALLGELAAMDRVHLIASIDHVNAPLLWSKREAARFNWVWQEASTFASYALETANLPQLLASKGEERHVRGAANVLRSLTANGRAIFRLLAEHQLENEDSQGMPLDMFYGACREQFLVSSEVTLRVHLTEFTDHELVRSKRGHDGRDLLSVPLCADALKELLAQFE